MKIKHVEVKQRFYLACSYYITFQSFFSCHPCNLLKGKSNWRSHSIAPPQNPMTHNTKGENPLDVPNLQEETDALPSNGSRLYNNNKRALD